MAINRDKVLASAVKLLQAGKFEKAIGEFRRLTADDPKDVRTILKIGDAYVKMGRAAEAIDSYQQVASIYSDQGFYLKAVAVYKQMLRVDANLPEVHQRLAEMYQQLGLNSDALQHFQQVAVHYEKEGDTEKSLSILKQMVDLDPDNVPSRIKLAELFAQQGMNEDATKEFRSAADYLLEFDRFDDYIRVGERLIFFDPRALDITEKLADVYLQRGEPKLALGKLQICFKADPRNLSILERIATAFLAMQQTEKTLSVYKEIARIHVSKNDKAEANRYWQKVLDLSPQDAEATAAMNPQVAAAPPSAVVPPPSASIAAPPSAPQVAPPKSQAQPAPAAVVPPVASEDEQVLRLVTETDVYIKYSLFDKAIEHLKRAVALKPNHIEVHDKLRSIYQSTNDHNGLLNELQILIEIGRAKNDPRVSAWQRDFETLSQVEPEEASDDIYVIEETGDSIIVDTQPLTPAAVVIPEPPEDEIFDPEELDAISDQLALPEDDAAIADPEPVSFEGPAVTGPNPFESPLGDMSDAEFLQGFNESVSEVSPALSEPQVLGSVVRELPDEPSDATEIVALSAEEMNEIRALVSEAGELGRSGPQVNPFAKPSESVPPVENLNEVASDAMRANPNPFATPPSSANPFDLPSEPDGPLVAVSEEDDAYDDEDIPMLVPDAPTQTTPPIESAEPMLLETPVAKEQAITAAPSPSSGVINPFAPGNKAPVNEERLPEGIGDLPDFNSPDFELPDLESGTFNVPDLDEKQLELQANPFEPSESDVFVAPELPELPAAEAPLEVLPETPAAPPVEATEVPVLESPGIESVLETEEVKGNLRDTLGLQEQAHGFEDDPAAAFFPDELEEAEFFIQQSIFDEAREILDDIIDNVPDSVRAQHMLARIDAAEAGEPAPLAPWEQNIIDKLEEDIEEFEFEAELTDQVSVEEVLSQFKKGVAETVDKDDAETHYNLGIAYREMGLLDDAISEFQMASKSPSHQIDCWHLIGLTQIDKAVYSEALETFEKAASGSGASAKQKAAAEYERGICFEHLQRFADAAVAYEKSKSLGGDMHDLEARIENAKSGTGSASKVGYV